MTEQAPQEPRTRLPSLSLALPGFALILGSLTTAIIAGAAWFHQEPAFYWSAAFPASITAASALYIAVQRLRPQSTTSSSLI